MVMMLHGLRRRKGFWEGMEMGCGFRGRMRGVGEWGAVCVRKSSARYQWQKREREIVVVT